MNEIMSYVNIIKTVLDRDYGKERVFYDSGEWYDRDTCKNLSLGELDKEVIDIITQSEEDNEYIYKLIEKIYELIGDDEAEIFLESINN